MSYQKILSEHELSLKQNTEITQHLETLQIKFRETVSGSAEEFSLLQAELSRLNQEWDVGKSSVMELEEERDDLLSKVDTAVQQILVLKKAAVKVDTSETGVLTEACDESVYEGMVRKLNDLDLEYDLLMTRFEDQEKKFDVVSSENRNLLQSNHKQKLQYMVNLKEDYNKVMTEVSECIINGLERDIDEPDYKVGESTECKSSTGEQGEQVVELL